MKKLYQISMYGSSYWDSNYCELYFKMTDEEKKEIEKYLCLLQARHEFKGWKIDVFKPSPSDSIEAIKNCIDEAAGLTV